MTITILWYYSPKAHNALKNGRQLSEREIQEEYTWIRAAQKDRRHFSPIYDRYFNGIFQFIYRRTDDEEVADDLTSQTFLKALQGLDKYEFRGLPISAWLYRIATNEVYRHFNKKGKQLVFSIEEDRVRELMAEVDTDDLEGKIQLILTTLKEAPADVVEVLELRFFEDRNFKEIAYILNITESGAKMRTYRALEKLKKLVESRPGYEQA